jgi:hypothetical protein
MKQQGKPSSKPRKKAPRLSEKHREELAKGSGLSEETIRAAGLYTESDPEKIGQLLGWDGPAPALGDCLVIPYFDKNGKPTDYRRLKPDCPRADADGNPVKYESPRGEETPAYFPPGIGKTLKNPTAPLLIVEGEKKALKLVQEGFPCVGLAGVWMGVRKKEEVRK